LERFERKVADFVDDVAKSFPDKLEKPLDRMVDKARNDAPRLTSKLANSIQAKDGTISSDAEHFWINEKGGSHPAWGRDPEVRHPARPFMAPAVEQYKKDVVDAAAQAAEEAGRKLGFS
jgi:hypothetical protein